MFCRRKKARWPMPWHTSHGGLAKRRLQQMLVQPKKRVLVHRPGDLLVAFLSLDHLVEVLVRKELVFLLVFAVVCRQLLLAELPGVLVAL